MSKVSKSSKTAFKPSGLLLANLLALLVCVFMLRALILPQQEEQSLLHYQQQIHSDAHVLSAYLNARKSEIRMLANLPVVQSMDWSRISPILMALKDDPDSSFEKLILGLPNSQAYTTSAGNPFQGGIITFEDDNPSATPKSISKRDYWRTLIKNNTDHLQLDYISNPMISYTNHKKQIVIGSTVRNPEGQVIALLGGTVDWLRITDIIEDIQQSYQPEETKYMLVSKDGNYWYHWDDKKVIQPIKDKDGHYIKDDNGERAVRLFNILTEEDEGLKGIGRNMVAGKSGQSEVHINQKSFQVFYTPIENTTYALAKVISKSQYRQLTEQLWLYLLVAFIAGNLAYLFLIYALPRGK